jgi:microsomal dipeptidase-like Zn-dependent dipeptidase
MKVFFVEVHICPHTNLSKQYVHTRDPNDNGMQALWMKGGFIDEIMVVGILAQRAARRQDPYH